MPTSRKFALFVHDLFLEIGHSNALIETIRNLPADKVEEIVVVAYTAGNLQEYFAELKCPVRLVKVPLPNLYPFILKEIFYHLWTWWYAFFFLRSYYKVGIGIAAFGMDLIDIQFVHHQWHKLYFDLLHPKGIAFIYKKILFTYYDIVERFIFTRTKVRFLALSKFVYNYCLQEFKIPINRIKTIYSGINLEKFSPSPLERIELYRHLLGDYPILQSIDINKPIYLFVGAFERKGLPLILQKIDEVPDAQLIVIGKPESSKPFHFKTASKCVHIEFTKDLPLFYSLADCFLFASFYEPFGLVIIEAAAMGCQMVVTRNQVGAVELLENLEGITIYDSDRDFKIEPIDILSSAQRQYFRQARLSRLRTYSWQKTGEELASFIDL